MNKNTIWTALLSTALLFNWCNTESSSNRTEAHKKQIQTKKDFYKWEILECIKWEKSYEYIYTGDNIRFMPKINPKLSKDYDPQKNYSLYELVDPNYENREDFKTFPILDCKIKKDVSKILEK